MPAVGVSPLVADAGVPHAQDLSAKRAQFAGPTGLKGIIANGKTTAIAFFASLGGLVYGCEHRYLIAGMQNGSDNDRQPRNVRSGSYYVIVRPTGKYDTSRTVVDI